tara:strand:- start:264 stop:1328 length:1065 start_codon:yes stop_codon:yes gene_type:complete
MELLQTFNKTLEDFAFNLRKCFPVQAKNFLLPKHENDTLPLQTFMKSIAPYLSNISNKDSTMFDSTIICNSCDLSIIWNSSNDDVNREAIWKYLQTLVLIGTTIRSKSNNLEQYFQHLQNLDDIQSDNLFNTTFDDIQSQMMNIVQELSDSNPTEFDLNDDNIDSESETNEPDTDGLNNPEDYAKMFENTKIGNLANEIAKDIDMSAFDDLHMESPDVQSVMSKLIGGGGLKNLIQTVAQSLKTKMESGDVNQDELMGEVSSMMEKMQGNKKFKKMFKGGNMQNMFKEFMKQQTGSTDIPQNDEDFSVLEEMFSKQMNNIPSNAKINTSAIKAHSKKASTRDRLRKKLESRKHD